MAEDTGKSLLGCAAAVSFLLGFFVTILPLSFAGALLGAALGKYRGSNYDLDASFGLKMAFAVACLLATAFSRLQSLRLRRQSEFQVKRYVATFGIVTVCAVSLVAPFWLRYCFY